MLSFNWICPKVLTLISFHCISILKVTLRCFQNIWIIFQVDQRFEPNEKSDESEGRLWLERLLRPWCCKTFTKFCNLKIFTNFCNPKAFTKFWNLHIFIDLTCQLKLHLWYSGICLMWSLILLFIWSIWQRPINNLKCRKLSFG